MKARALAPWFALLSAALLMGCGPKPAEAPKDTETKPEEPVAAAPDPSEIPESLKHGGFKYYGLDSAAAETYELDRNGVKLEGTQKAVFSGMVDGKATFTIERTEGLSDLGNETLEVREDGVYLTKSGANEVDPAVLSLPKDPKVGDSWPVAAQFTGPNGDKVSIKATQKVTKQEKLTTKAGDFDCLVVTMTGELTSGDKKSPVTGTSWYASGVGTVKLTVSSKDADGKPTSYSVTLVKRG